jgi:quercetin dioxygenase-like cupin family protein
MEHESLGPPFPPPSIPPGAGDQFNFGAYSVHWKIDGSQTGHRFSIIHQIVAPRTLVAPLHRHHREDEFSHVLTGTLGVLLGDAVVTAEPHTWVFQTAQSVACGLERGRYPMRIY